jgi:hypothetical protein
VRVGVVLLALAVAMSAWQILRADGEPVLAGTAVVTASSTQFGSAAAAVVDSGEVRTPGARWRSDAETVGAWIELSWAERHALQQIVIVRNPVSEPGVTAGFLSFGDGSVLQVTLSSSAETVIPFSPRTVDRLRFTASEVGDGAPGVQIAEILVSTSANDPVAVDEVLGGNAAARATVTASGGDPRALQDSPDGAPGVGWTVDTPTGAWVQFDWSQPEEIASIELVGAPASSAALSRATVTIPGAAPLPIGAVLNEPTRPTLVGFMPRVTRSLRLTLDGVDGSGPLTLGELRVYRRGGVPPRRPTAPPPPTPAPEAACAPPPAPTAGSLVVSCPVNGSSIDGPVSFLVSALGSSTVTATAWPGREIGPAVAPVQATPDPAGFAHLVIDASPLPPGPVTVRFAAIADGRESTIAYFQLYRRGTGSEVASSPAAAGRTLVYAEEFDRPISISRSGADADYAAAKPVHDGVQDFGDAIFADPGQGFDNVRVVDDSYLRIGIEPKPPGYTDPQGWGRNHLGGMLASARPGGSGFSARYGYFEARMLVPAAPGTWPAFWMLPSDNLVAPTPTVAEIDAVELYGHAPMESCQSTHDFRGGDDSGVARCGKRFGSERAALSWHTYGVSVLPSGITYFIDGQVVATAPQVRGGGAPMFFLLDLALGGGWPIDLRAVQDRAALYVDYVRVYV